MADLTLTSASPAAEAETKATPRFAVRAATAADLDLIHTQLMAVIDESPHYNAEFKAWEKARLTKSYLVTLQHEDPWHVMSLLTELANRMQAQGAGQLAVIGSVAGDRGRPSNYVYGTAKAAVATFCEGLRARLYPHNVNVLLIKPGFVDTPMTAAFRKGPLWAKPDLIAKLIVRALDRRKSVIYTPPFWALIMLIIRSIPRPIFVRLKL